MIVYKTGDIFTSKAELLVNPVNCVGVMGAGLAKQFKERFPENFEEYINYCDNGDNEGNVKQPGGYFQYDNILNVFTKNHWRGKTDRYWIDMIAMSIAEHIEFNSIAIPPIGCGLGGLDKDEVHLILLRELGIYADDEDVVIELWNFK